MTSSRRAWPFVIVASCDAVALATLLEAGEPVRALLAFWFFLISPGMAVVGLLGIEDRLAELVLAVAVSLALDTGVALVMVLAKVWSPDAGLAVLIAISVTGATLQGTLGRRSRRSNVPAASLSP